MRIDGLQVQEGSTITNPVLPSGGTFPTSPDIGELFYLSSGNIGLHVYDGTGWAKVVGDASFQAAINNLLSKSGGTLTGPLVLPGNPTQNLEAATKQYVDGLASGVIPNTVLPGAGLTKTSETLDVVGSAGRIVVNADNIDLAATGVFAGEYTRMTVDVYGRVTGGTIPTTLAGYGIVDAAPLSHVGTGSTAHAIATQIAAGFMSSTDKTQLDNLVISVNAHAALSSAHGVTGAIVGTTDIQTLTNKTLASPVISGNVSISGSATANNFTISSTDASGATQHIDTSATAAAYIGGSTSMVYEADTQHIHRVNGVNIATVTPTGLDVTGAGTFSSQVKCDQMLNITGATGNIWSATTWNMYVNGAIRASLSPTGLSVSGNMSATMYVEQVNVLGSISGAVTINNQSGTYVTATLAGATTFTFSGAAAAGDACGFILELTNGGAAAITWPTSIKWASGIAPSLTAAGVDILCFSTRDNGATWHGVVASKDSK